MHASEGTDAKSAILARSFLFVPGDRPERFDKALKSGADEVILDLEDGVSVEKKRFALHAILSWLSPSTPVYVRLNGTETDWFEHELASLSGAVIAGVMLPKVEGKEQLMRLAERLPEQVPVIPAIESALGLWKVEEIARAPRVTRLAFGSVDFQLDTGIRGEYEALLFARSKLVLASRIAGILPPIDGVTTTIDDTTRLVLDTFRAKDLGFGGKLCIHPKQVATVNEGFLPTKEEVGWAQRIMDAVKEKGDGAIRLNGQLVDRPIIERAKRTLQYSHP